MVKLINCSYEHWEFVRRLRNDPNNKPGFIQQNEITKEQQTAYMIKHSTDYKICVDDGVPVGFIGDIDGDIRICVDHDKKRRGYATFMITEYLRIRKNVFAKVKIENQASLALFQKCGLVPKYILLEPKYAS